MTINTSDRIERYKKFGQFLKNSDSSFSTLLNCNKRFKDFDNYYTLHICPGGSNGGANDRELEIFYGERPFDVQRRDPYDRNKLNVLIEYGARLHYNLLDNGMVVALLYPAKTDNISPIENSIIISRNIDPNCLLKLSKRHFLFFNSYMRCTSLDGNPNLLDKFIVYWIRFTSHLIIDGKIQSLKYILFFSEIIKYVLTVGFSGFLLSIILTIYIQQHDYTIDIDNVYKKLISIEGQEKIISDQLDIIKNAILQHRSKKGQST